jgi:hypothetical protein
MSILYTFAIDRDDDGAFNGTHEDITTRVLEAQWRLGMAKADESVAPPATAQLTLRNHDGLFSPQNGFFTVGKRLRISSFDGAHTRTHFTGYITQWLPSTPNHAERVATLIAQDVSQSWAHTRITLSEHSQPTAEVLISDILRQVPLRHPVLKARWLLGRAHHSELATHTRFVTPHSHSLQTGQTVFAYVGDDWAQGIRADHALERIVEAERGRLFVDRNGVVTFLNRHHLLKNETSQATLDDDFLQADYDFGRELWASVSVRCRPRTLGNPNSIVWQSRSVITIEPYGAVQFALTWHDAQTQPIGAIDIQTPQANSDYSVNTLPNGNGQNVSDALWWEWQTVGLSGATVQLRNPFGYRLYVLPNASVRGTPLITDAPLTVQARDYGAQNVYNGKTHVFDLGALDRVEQAQALARFELSRHKTPRGMLHSLTLDARQHPQAVLGRTLFERITVQNAQTNFQGDAFIISEAHHITHGGHQHRVTWQLESAEAHRFWVLGRRNLTQDTVLAY